MNTLRIVGDKSAARTKSVAVKQFAGGRKKKA